jgi:DNA polymerase
MRWTDRQRRMLEAMGLRVWAAPARAVQADEPSTADDRRAAPSRPAAARAEPGGAQAAKAARATPVAPVAPVAQVAQSARAVQAAGPATVSARQPPAAGADVAAAVGPGDATTASPVADLDARARDIASLDWPALRAAVAACTACGLCRSRRQTVFGVGHEQARWMVVGEAPGEQEDLKGEPFVGPAGKLLDAMLHAVGLTRDEAPPERQVYIANTLKCRPPRNRNPEPDELAMCEPFLARQIELVQPRIIVAMGRFAVQALLRSSEPIGRLRGRVHAYRGVPLVVTYHPAYLLRNLVDKARAWDDLLLAAATVEAAGG